MNAGTSKEPELSVAICTHNPRIDYLDRVLAGLAAQSVPLDKWELLLIDNSSDSPLEDVCNLSWHPRSRVLRENELGLTPTRLRVLKEAAGPVVLFVDDDNILDPDYLETVTAIGLKWPLLGAWGAGILKGEFEIPVAEWLTPYLWYITVHEVPEDRWSNQPDLNVFPPGAGLAVRKEAAQSYVDVIERDDFRRGLDRRGSELTSCGDMDMLWTITEQGCGVGRFRALRLTHLIPKRRLEEDYIEKLIENMWCSNLLLKAIHGTYQPEPPDRLIRRLQHRRFAHSLPPRQRWAHEAELKGRRKANKILMARTK